MNTSTQVPVHYPHPAFPPPPGRNTGYGLQILQQPERGKVVVKGKDKGVDSLLLDRKPIDPPPILQLHGPLDNNPCPYWFNPYLFCTVTLFDPLIDRAKEQDDPTMPTLVGASASSLHRLKDLSNTEGAFFVFGDLAATVVGKARLHFCLYELDTRTGNAMMVHSTTSQPFDVQVPRDWEGVKESTILSRTFSDQGVKLRLRKESRAAQRRRSFHPQPAMPPMPHQPLRPHPGYDLQQLRTPGHGGYGDPQQSIRSHSSTHGSFDDNGEDDTDERDSKRPRNYATSAALNYSSHATAAGYGPSGHQASYSGGVGTPEQPSYTSAPPGSNYGSTASPHYGSSYPPSQSQSSYQQSSYGQPPNPYTPSYQYPPSAGYNPQGYGPSGQYSAPTAQQAPYASSQYQGYNQSFGYGGGGGGGGGYGMGSSQSWSSGQYGQQHGALPSRGGYPPVSSSGPTLPPTSSIATSQPQATSSMQTNRLPPLANLPSISAPPLSQTPSSGPSVNTSSNNQQSGSGPGQQPYSDA